MAPFILLLLAIFFSPAFSDRRILHQPFLPEDGSQPPHPSPPPPTSPDIPFTPAANSTPFFPEIPSPPPPSPATFASVPANISSLTLPEGSKSRPANKKLVPIAIASVIAAVIVVSIAVGLHLRRQRRRRGTSGSDAKTQRSDSTIRPSYVGGGGGIPIPKLQRPSQTSSEFLYLGTLVNSHGAIDSSVIQQQNPRASSTADGSSAANSRKFDSPELRPLPPLAGGFSVRRQNNRSGDGGFSVDDEADEFYSPRGSLGGRSSSGNGSASRRGFAGIEVEKLMHSSSTSSSSSSSGSNSPARSVSLSISPPASRSPKISRPKSPELVALQSVPLPPPPPPPPLPLYSVQWAPRNPSAYTSSPSPSPSPSPPSSSSPERVYSRSRESSPRFFDSPIRRPPALPPVPPLSIPPPPPPPPPGKSWESPRTPSPAISKMASKPPTLVTALKPVPLEVPNLISPMQLPGNSEPHVKIDVNDDDDTFELRNLSNGVETPKPKLKPLHWDKVRASSDREMVWDQLKSSSFKLNEEMIETLFVVNNPTPNSKENTRRPILPSPTQENRVLDPKKSQNISILLRAVNVTVDEVCEALIEGNVENLGTDLLESLLKMAPTKEEERKLKEYKDDSPVKLGPAERFLKALLDIPLAFKRVDAMLYISNFESEIEYLKRSFDTLEAACEELRNSRMFLKLLEAVLKTGNRMNVGTNRGDAHAFKLDTLLKLVDVKGADGKTTLLHFVVQEIIRSEGARHASANQDGTPTVNDDVKCRRLGLQVVSGLTSDLTNVKKSAAMDSEVLNSEVQKLSIGLSKIAEVVRSVDETDPFAKSMNGLVKMAEEEMIRIQAQESVALTLVKEITEYFHGNSAKEEAHPFRIFMVVRDFLAILDRVCKEVGMINERTIVSSAHKFPVPVNPNLQPNSSGGFAAKHPNNSSSDEDSF